MVFAYMIRFDGVVFFSYSILEYFFFFVELSIDYLFGIMEYLRGLTCIYHIEEGCPLNLLF